MADYYLKNQVFIRSNFFCMNKLYNENKVNFLRLFDSIIRHCRNIIISGMTNQKNISLLKLQNCIV